MACSTGSARRGREQSLDLIVNHIDSPRRCDQRHRHVFAWRGTSTDQDPESDVLESCEPL